VRKLVKGLSLRLREGSSFSNALKDESSSFGDYYISSVRSGEESGDFGKFLENIYAFLERQEKFENKVKSASFYPLFILSLTTIVVIALISYIVPSIVDLAKILDTTLPTATLRLIRIANFFKEYWLFIIFGAIFISLLFRFFVNKFKYFFDTFLLKIPYLSGIIRKTEYLKFFRELALLVRNSIQIEKAVLISEEALSNLRLRDEVESARRKLIGGYDLSESLSSFVAEDSYLFSLLKIGEESNRVSENISFANSVLEREIEERRERILKSIEPVMLIIIGVIILTVIYNLYLPILNMLNGIDFTSF